MTESYVPAIYTFTGAGNDFVVLDGRKGGMEAFRHPHRIGELCREYRTDGLMILDNADGYDFSMEFYNPDGTGGMMCGNGGRCIVAFASYLGLKPASADGTWHFIAPDGPHEAVILEGASSKWTVRLKMIDVQGVTPMKDGYFLNTGTRHFVKFIKGVDTADMEADAKPLRWDKAFQPEGTNVNLVEVRPDGLHVRTYETGVEGETLACGTGLTASAIAAFQHGIPDQAGDDEGPGDGDDRHGRPDAIRHGRHQSAISYRLQCRRGDWLQVDFTPQNTAFTDVYLTGPAELLAVN